LVLVQSVPRFEAYHSTHEVVVQHELQQPKLQELIQKPETQDDVLEATESTSLFLQMLNRVECKSVLKDFVIEEQGSAFEKIPESTDPAVKQQ
jgi:hypothetical protein